MKTLLIISTLCLITATPAHALINGTTLDGMSDLVRLVFKNGNACTGAFIDRTTILTAAHCLGKGQGDRIEKILTAQDAQLVVEEFESVQHPLYEPGSWMHDIGVINTSPYDSFSGQFKLEMGWVPFFGEAHFFGTGLTNMETKDRGRTEGKGTFFRVGPFLFSFGDSSPDPAHLGKKISIAPNDSGAPIVRESTGTLIAVATKTTINESFPRGLPSISFGTSLDTPSNRKFVVEYIEKQPQ